MDLGKYNNVRNLGLFDRVKLQLLKYIENRAEEKIVKERFRKWMMMGDEFVLEGDVDLTSEQIREIKKFWGRYKFAYPEINFNEFKAYMNRTGVFDYRYIPAGIKTLYIAPYLQHKHYYWSEQNKALLDKTFNNIKQPTTIIRRMNGYYYDGEYNRINLPIAIHKCLEHLALGKEIIVKPNESGGGRGIKFLNTATEESLKNIFIQAGQTFVVQDVLRQHEKMSALNPYSVNTLRITSIIWNNKVTILAAVLRIGNSSKRVDNWSAGGMIVGILKERGSLYCWGSDKNSKKSTETIGGYSCPWDIQFRLGTRCLKH